MRAPSLALLVGISFAMAAPAKAGPGPFSNAWSSDTESRFEHVIEDMPGKLTLTLKAQTTQGGLETVAVYFMDKHGNKSTAWRMFVVANKAGESRSKSFTLAKPKFDPKQPERKTNSVRAMVAVENASKRVSTGEYTLTVSR